MKAVLNRLTAPWTFAAALFGLWAWTVFPFARASAAGVFWILFALLAAVGAGLLLRQSLARLTALPLLAGMVCLKLYGLAAHGFTWKQLLYASSIAFLTYFLWKKPDAGLIDDFTEMTRETNRSEETEAEDDSKPMISLVHLRARPRYLEPSVLAQALSEAWNLKIVGGDGDGDADHADGFVAGEGPVFVVMVQKPTAAMFLVHNHEKNYFDEPEEVAEGVANLRFAQIIREHGAWLAVDLMNVQHGQIGQDDAYRLIGKAISALADDDAVAILCPQHHFFNLWSPELETILCGNAPLDALNEEVKAPVISVPDGDVIEKAIAQARRQWPEFVASFQSRQPDDERYIVKAPFLGEDGQTEHMWLQVFALEPEYVHGHLVNHPMHTAKLKQGSQVEVPVADISDWVCPDADGRALGNFTQLAISQAARPQCSP